MGCHASGGRLVGRSHRGGPHHTRRPQPDPLRNVLLGELDAQIYTGTVALDQATNQAANPELSSDDVRKLALRVRNSIYRACQTIQRLSKELAGPQLLTRHEQFNKADADLTVYLSQHHGIRDEADLGAIVIDSP